MARALLIDLDDTLYDERSYVLSGFRAVAAEVARRIPRIDAGALCAAMVAELDAHGRGRVFDRTLARAGVAPEPALIADLVETYRAHRPQIALWPGVADTLRDLARDHGTAIVTDGLSLMQQRKVDALGVKSLAHHVLYAWDHAPKPDPACYVEALRRLDARPEEAVVIGDHPAHDMAAARAIGACSIRVLTGRFAAAGDQGFPADLAVPTFLDVAKALRSGLFKATA